jgi:hypothetical protein
MIEELRRLCCLFDTNNINMRARYIRSAINVWADKLIRHLDSHERKLDPFIFAELDSSNIYMPDMECRRENSMCNPS